MNAQITFNNDGVNLSSATGNAPDLSKTVAAGTDRLLVVFIGTDDLTNTPTVTYNGSNMTLGAQDDDFGSSNLDAQIFIFYQVLGTGSSISSTVSVTGITSEYFTGAASWQGVDQASPMVNSVAAGIPMNIQMTMTLGSIGTGNLII